MNSQSIRRVLLQLLLITGVLSFPHTAPENEIQFGAAIRNFPSSPEDPVLPGETNQSNHSSGPTPGKMAFGEASRSNLSQEVPEREVISGEESLSNLSSRASPENGVIFGETKQSDPQEAVLAPKVIKELLDEQSVEESEHVTFDNIDEESEEVDAFGCNLSLKTKLEHRCDYMYDKAFMESELMEESHSKTEATCCALEDYEKCNLQAYDKANCGKLKAAARENIKATHLFLSMLSNISCTEFRGQCLFYPSSGFSLRPVFGVIMAALVLVL